MMKTSELPINRIFVDGHGMCEVWSLPKVAPKKQRAGKYVQESFTHPAKMDTVLCRKIIETYTREGETVLDPMSGIGTTLVESMLLSRNAVGVELEDKFVKLSKQNIKLIENAKTLTPKGKAVVIKGDSRELSKILGEKADVAVFSPPFAEAQSGGGIAKHGYDGPKHGKTDLVGRRSYMSENVGDGEGNISRMPYGEINTIVTSPPYAPMGDRQNGEKIAKTLAKHDATRGFDAGGSFRGGYGTDDRRNIGNPRKYGKVDSVIFSPPYSKSIHPTGEDPAKVKRKMKERMLERKKQGLTTGGVPDTCNVMLTQGYGKNPNNIGNLSHGKVDSVIFSPPYSESMSKRRKGYTTHPELSKTRHMGEGSSNKNIGNLRHGEIDVVITSPPYEAQVSKKTHEMKRLIALHKEGKLRGEIKRKVEDWLKNPDKNRAFASLMEMSYSKNVDAIVTSSPYQETMSTKRHDSPRSREISADKRLHLYPASKDNIGSKKGETYLQAMFQVYRECLKILKQGGKMVIVLKDFIRNKKVVRLDLDTKRLCEAAGFRWVETKLFKLPSKSFWRTLYEKKYPAVDTSLLKHEFCEVFEKPMEAYA